MSQEGTTPRPWKRSDRGVIMDADGHPVAAVQSLPIGNLILTAVNQHDALTAVAEAARLRRNTVIRDREKFVGEWVAVPLEDFNRLVDALAAYRALVEPPG